MWQRGHTEEEILRVLREAEAGETLVEACRKGGITSILAISDDLALRTRSS